MDSVRRELQTLQRVAEEQETRIVQQPASAKSAQGICIRWHEQGHKDALEQIFAAAAKSSSLPGNMVFEWNASSKYAVVLLVLYPATNRLDESVIVAIRECQAAASSVVLVALRWGQTAPELNLSKLRDGGAAVDWEQVDDWEKEDGAEQKLLVHCPKNDKSVAELRGILRSALPERQAGPVAAGLARLVSWPWR